MELPAWAPSAARRLAAVSVLLGWTASAVGAQTLSLAERGPRFLLASSSRSEPVEIDAGSSAMLRRVVSLDLERPTVGKLLESIERQTGLRFAFDRRLVPVAEPVALRAEAITVAAALTAILGGTEVDVLFSSGRQVALVKRRPRAVSVQEGSMVGRVTAKRGNAPLVGAAVEVQGTQLGAITEMDGQYRIASVPAGTYSVRARYIGFTPLTATVTVTPGQEVSADFALEQSAQLLDEVVTTGTLVPTEVKALPTPVTVITAEDIAKRRAYDLGELFREAIPTAIARRNVVSSPTVTFFSVRGTTSLISPSGRMKVFVDGLESADRANGGVDLASIERVEIIRGPQAAAIYGSDAIAGVIQIFTKRGSPGLAGLRASGDGAWGLVQSPYSGFETALRHSYTASAQGGDADANYHFGASYEHTGPHVPEGERSNGGVSGGVRLARGIMSVDLSGRYFVYHTPLVFNPVLAQSGVSDFAAPYHQSFEEQDQAFGVRLSLAPSNWWRHSVTMGVDRRSTDMAQTQPRRTFPEDTLLSAYNANQTKISIGYNTSVQGSLNPSVSGVVTVGADHYRLPSTEFSNFGGLLTTDGALTPVPDNPIVASRSTTTNTGLFAQGQLGLRDALFFTAGVRGEDNSNFGDSLGTPLSPRVGVSYVREMGAVTLKLRGAWGRAIKAPSFGAKLGAQSAFAVRLPNLSLGPERQQGWDGGIDAVFGSHGSLSITYYNQRADNLIDFVTLATTPVRTTQLQNVGRVRNTGLEVEGTLAVGPARLKGQYGYGRARVEQLAPGYGGDQRVGEQVIGVPTHTAGVLGSIDLLRGTSLSAGLSYVGSSTNYDWVAFYRCLGGTGACRNDTFALGDYLMRYPSFVRLNATISQRFTRVVSGFVRVENLTNNEAFEFPNDAEVIGRITTVGVRFGD